jgi:hypothetical protein
MAAPKNLTFINTTPSLFYENNNDIAIILCCFIIQLMKLDLKKNKKRYIKSKVIKPCLNFIFNPNHDRYEQESTLNYKTLLKKFIVLSFLGVSNISFGVPCSTTMPSSINKTLSATSLAKPISWVTITMVMPLYASSLMT